MAMLQRPVWPETGAETIDSVIVAGRRIFHLVRGEGPPVVLIHGLGGSWRWWSRNIDVLAKHFRVYALDLGRRESWLASQGRVRPVEAADILDGWLAAVGIDRAHIVGHSLGGHMAIRLAATYPRRVDRLVLVNAAGLPFGMGLLRLTKRAFGPAPERTRDFRRLVVADSIRTNPLVVLQTARDMMRDDISGLLGQVAAPTFIIWGARDHVVPLANAYALHAGIAGSRLLLLPHAGHNPMYYHAGTFNRVVHEFFEAVNVEPHGDGGSS